MHNDDKYSGSKLNREVGQCTVGRLDGIAMSCSLALLACQVVLKKKVISDDVHNRGVLGKLVEHYRVKGKSQ